MREQKESNSVWFIAILAMFVIVALRCFDDNITLQTDATFLYNRCFQMVDCLRHGYFPFIYYNDVGGIGYASPIFYGQFTLVPFVLFLNDIAVFIKVYYLCCIVLNFFAFRCFLKRISSSATLGACFYIVGLPFVRLCDFGVYAYIMGVGFGWFFIAYCIDYFRDNKNFAPLLLFYFLCWDANFNSAALYLFVCFCLFVRYFKRDRILSYLRLFCFACVLFLFNFVSMFANRDALSLYDLSDSFSGDTGSIGTLFSLRPFGGFLPRTIMNMLFSVDLATGFMQFGILALFVFVLIKHVLHESLLFRVEAGIICAGTVFLYIIGMHPLWGSFYSVTNVFFQFPIRYLVICYGFVVAIVARYLIKSKAVLIVLILCVLDFFIIGFRVWESTLVETDLAAYIVLGEYTGSSFIAEENVWLEYSSSIHSESGSIYSYTNDYNGLTVDCSSNASGDVLTLPKLYYRWYQAVGDNGEQFKISSGYSNYCEVDIGTYTGSLYLRYRVPFVIMLLLFVQVVCLLWLLAIICKRRLVCFESAEGK